MIYLAILIIIVDLAFIAINIFTFESDDEELDLFTIQATAAYTTEKPKTASGFIKGKPEWAGNIAAVYKYNDGNVGELVGYFECLDTRKEPRNKEIVIYMRNREKAEYFGRQIVYITILKGEGFYG